MCGLMCWIYECLIKLLDYTIIFSIQESLLIENINPLNYSIKKECIRILELGYDIKL